MFKSSFSVKALTVSAILLALATALSQIEYSLPFGGSVTPCSMLFISLIGYFFGPVVGIAAGVTDGLLQLVIKPYVVHPVQLLLDYPLAFGALGVSGFFRTGKNALAKGYLAGISLRFIMSFLSGAIFFSQYTPDGWNFIVYSAVYNFSYIFAEGAFTMIVLYIPAFKYAVDYVSRRYV